MWSTTEPFRCFSRPQSTRLGPALQGSLPEQTFLTVDRYIFILFIYLILMINHDPDELSLRIEPIRTEVPSDLQADRDGVATKRVLVFNNSTEIHVAKS